MFLLRLFSITEIIFAIIETKIPKAIIDKPKTSNKFIFIKVIAKYMKIIKLIRWEIKEKESPIFILR